jgi:PKD repeat protein
VITLKGSPAVTIVIGSSYIDEGAEATDNYDKDLKIDVKGTVNPNIAGDYTIEYTVTDQSGNKAETITRIIHVIEKSATQKPVESPVG